MTHNQAIVLAPLPAFLALDKASQQTRDYISASIAPATKRAYASDWRDFDVWCRGHGLRSLPSEPETIAVYISERAAGLRPSTLERRLSAISQIHSAAGHDSPTQSPVVRRVMGGVRRVQGAAPAAKMPLTVADLRRIIATTRPGSAQARDRALLLIGFAGAFRRSELVSLNVDDVEHVSEGIVITLRRSKIDQTGIGRRIGVPYGEHTETCPVRALDAWLVASGITQGPIFRPVDVWGNVAASRLSDRAVALVVKKHAARIGRDAATFAGHSLRAGFATAAAREGASERAIMLQTGHRSLGMVRRYIRDGSLFHRNAAATLGL